MKLLVTKIPIAYIYIYIYTCDQYIYTTLSRKLVMCIHLHTFFNTTSRKPKFSRHINLNHTILHYYCRKQHKNIENSRIIKKNVIFLCLLRLALPLPSSTAEFYQFLDTVLCKFFMSQVIIRLCRI